ncbi:hypothetical protein MIND_00788100 [Mycena indigotica]|uniref:Uncharacterized protein n=1 Tax=Mycena indigotica TaxID=2126181 RepID=A0A8H6SNU6_9AGAR|nr:uncharacterized protein MIND_00788100 [Mycena indigotica]KAF7302212.1 hypothetical protein MIND_00788100 [Mycena indigotica]
MAEEMHTHPLRTSKSDYGSTTSLLSRSSSVCMTPRSRRRSWFRWTNIMSIVLHIGLVVAHVVLLALARRHVERRITFPIEQQSMIAFLVTALLTGWSTMYLAAAVFVTQRLATLLDIHSRQTLTATNDNIASWGGLGSSLLNIYRQRTAPAAIWSSFSIVLYLGGVSILQISAPALVSVAGFNGTQFSGVVSTLGLPSYPTSLREDPGMSAYIGLSIMFFPWLSNIDQSHRMGLFNGSLYETVNHAVNPDLPLGITDVSATGFLFNCGYLPGSANFRSGAWDFNLGSEGGIRTKTRLSATGPNITILGPVIDDTPTNAIILVTTNQIVDSSGRLPDGGVVHLDEPMGIGDFKIDMLQFILCTRELVSQRVTISLQDNQIHPESLRPRLYKTHSKWLPYTDVWSPERPIRNDTMSVVENDELWVDLLYALPDSSVAPGVIQTSTGLSTASLFLMERLKLEPTWHYSGKNTSSNVVNSIQTVYLHNIENALSELAATTFWTIGHVTPNSFQSSLMHLGAASDGHTDIISPTLRAGTASIQAHVLQARLELNIIAISIGLAASILICGLALRYALQTNEESVLQREINTPGVLQTLWLSQRHSELQKKLVQIHKPSNERLRRAGMVHLKLAQDREAEASRDFTKQPGSASDTHKPRYSRRDQLICLGLHVAMILVHAILLVVLLNHTEHRCTFPLSKQQSMSLWVTILSTSIGTLYLALVLFLTQRAALKRLLDIQQTLSATHDQVSSWSGLGAALAAILNQFTVPTAINGTLAVLIYLGVLSLLHVTIPSMFSVQAFNLTTTIPVTTLGKPLWPSQDDEKSRSTQFLKDISEFMVWRDALNDSMTRSGLRENTLYDVLSEGTSTATSRSRFVDVAAIGFDVTCGFPTNVSLTRATLPTLPNIKWNISVDIENGQKISFSPPPSGPNILTSFAMVDQRDVESDLGWPSLILYTTANVVDSTGAVGNPVKFSPESLDLNGTVSSIQFIQCSRSIVKQNATVDAITTLLKPDSLTPNIRKTSSTWAAYSDPAAGIAVAERVADPRGPMESGLWMIDSFHSSFVPLSLPSNEIDMLSIMDLFVMDKLKLDPSWLKNSTAPPSPMQTVYLHDVENALADFAASFFWAAGHVVLSPLQLRYQFSEHENSTFKNSRTLDLQRKTVLVEMDSLTARLELNLVAVFAGLVASTVSLVVAFQLVWHDSQSDSSRGGCITTLNVLQIIWLSRNNPQLSALALDRVVTPTEDNLRAAGMVTVRLLDD